jgi:hypothetical protein
MLIGFINVGNVIYNLVTGNDIMVLAWSFSAFIFFSMARFDFYGARIKALEKKVEALENEAITDIDKISNNNYMVRRRLGPDKDVPYPEEE